MTPPVLIVKPERETDGGTTSSDLPIAEDIPTDDRREPSEFNTRRLRVGLCGLLKSTDRTHTITVLYSVDARGVCGRLRLVDPKGVYPQWLNRGSKLWLSGYDGVPLRIRITADKLRPEDKNDEHFAEFVVQQIPQ
ncbi:MAG TPA: hypothetical protein VM096_06920 [Vicinamibacterales bacterium]|nr:hypothetical protein [Vicinamibacterales bacterium]